MSDTDGLVGRCFIVRSERGRTLYQGLVRCIIPSQLGDLVLVQYFEAMFGRLNTMALVSLESMVSHDGGLGGYIFFQTDEHMRDYFDEYQHERDKRLDDLGGRDE